MRRTNPPKKMDIVPVVVAAGIAYLLWKDSQGKTYSPGDPHSIEDDPKLDEGGSSGGSVTAQTRSNVVYTLQSPPPFRQAYFVGFSSSGEPIYEEDPDGNPEISYV